MGVLGGAFNPPHLGHLVLAQEAAMQLGLDQVVFVPTGEASHKRVEKDPGARVRFEMTRLAVEGDERFTVSEAEVGRSGPSYTYETLEELGKESDRELVFLMGADAAAGLGEWRNPERVVELARIGIAGRSGVEREEILKIIDAVGGEGRADFVEMPEIGVSSSLVRERVAAGRPLRYLVPEAVEEFIAEKGLYA